MDTRSRIGSWIVVAGALLALAGCGSDGDMSGSGGRGGSVKPITGQAGNATAGSGADPLSGIGNPTMPAAPMRTMPINVEKPCASTSIVANRVLPTVMLVVDGSTSMQMPYGTLDGDGGAANPMMMAPAGPSRWSAIRDALVKPDVGVVPSLQGLVKFGLALFGTAPSCPLPFGILDPVTNNYMPINNALPQQPPGMFTPTGLALDQVVDKLPDPTLAVDKIIGPQIVVLATDGEPNACGSMDIFAGLPMTDYGPSIAAANKLKAKHIKMFVVSVAEAGGMFASHLQEMANIGANMPPGMNAPVYYPENPAQLAETLKTLIGDQLSCDLALDGKGVKVDKACMLGTVELNGEKLKCDDQANGWKVIDETHIQLLGKACDTFKDAVDARLTANFPCEVFVTI